MTYFSATVLPISGSMWLTFESTTRFLTQCVGLRGRRPDRTRSCVVWSIAVPTLAPSIEDGTRRVHDLVRRHGWNAMAFQTLEAGYSYFFHGDACVAYVDT